MSCRNRHHGGLAVEHPLVHVDVDDLGAVVDLLARDLQCGVEVVVADQPRETCRAGDVGPLTDIHEQRVIIDGQGFEAAQGQRVADRRQGAGSLAV